MESKTEVIIFSVVFGTQKFLVSLENCQQLRAHVHRVHIGLTRCTFLSQICATFTNIDLEI